MSLFSKYLSDEQFREFMKVVKEDADKKIEACVDAYFKKMHESILQAQSYDRWGKPTNYASSGWPILEKINEAIYAAEDRIMTRATEKVRDTALLQERMDDHFKAQVQNMRNDFQYDEQFLDSIVERILRKQIR